MTDPRNIAHDKKVQQEKKHQQEVAPGADEKPQPGKKPHLHHATSAPEGSTADEAAPGGDGE